MQKANDEILAKVKKLLALGESPSEAEAASALEKARSLLARYGLSMSDVEATDSLVTEGTLLEKRRLRKWEAHLVFVVTQATFTQALHVSRGDSGRVLIIGREVNVAAAAELFAYLHLAVLKLGRAHGDRVAHLESFKMGVVHRLGERLSDGWAQGESGGDGDGNGTYDGATTGAGARSEDGMPSGAAGQAERQLTVQMERTASRENKAYIDEKFGKTKTKRTGGSVDAHSFHQGRAAGDSVSLNRQLR